MKKKTIAPEEPKFYVVKKIPRVFITPYGAETKCSYEERAITLSELKKYIEQNGMKNIECILEYKPVEITNIVLVGGE